MDVQSQASYGHEPYTHKLQFKGESVQTTERKQIDAQTNATDCLTFPANAVGNYINHQRFSAVFQVNVD